MFLCEIVAFYSTPQFRLTTPQVLNSHMWLVTSILGGIGLEENVLS